MKRKNSFTVLAAFMVPLAGWSAVSEAGQLSPGDVTTETAVITAASPLINTPGTYNIMTSDRTISVTGAEKGARLISGSSAGDIVVNGNIQFTSRDVLSHYLIQATGGKSITINGNMKVDSLNTTQLNVPYEWAPRGVQIMEYTAPGTKLTFNGDFDFTVYNDMDPNGRDDSYTVAAVMAPDTEINFNGNVRIVNTVDHYDHGYGGANAVYAEHNSTLNMKGDQIVLQTISWRPHAISAKDGATVNIDAQTLQIIGCIDLTEDTAPELAKGGTVNAVLSGADSYWYGDEINVNGTGVLNLTVKDGAVYMPFGTVRDVGVAPVLYHANPYGAKKYLSSLDLEDGGIVDLFDEDAQSRWEAVGLDSRYSALKQANLDYLMVNDLKGTNGIFRLDMNDQDKSRTDMIYVLQSTEGEGLHRIEAYNDNNFSNISASNTLRFATVAAPAADKLIFKDKMNIYGNTLWDYNVLIGHSPYDINDPENAIYNGNRDGLTADQINQLMAGGMNWFIYGLSKTPSDHAEILIDSAYASYDAATHMDRYNKRHGEARFLEDGSPVWVRLIRGNAGRDGAYDGLYTMGQIGLEFGRKSHHYGVALDYLSSTADLSRGNGTAETKRRGILLYNTLTGNNGSYLDLVGRYGRVYSDIDGYNRHTGDPVSGDYSHIAYSFSAEYGRKFQKTPDAFFLEPQVQLQYTHLNGTDYTADNRYRTHIDGADSLIGRLGLRAGRKFKEDSSWYVKADILREFTGGQDFTLRAPDSFMSGSVHKKGTWYDIGLGADIKIAPRAVFTCDLERSFGGDAGRNWEFNVGTRWNF